MNDNTNITQTPVRPFNGGKVAAGVIVITMGVLMFLDQTEALAGYSWRLLPGLVLIAIGLVNFGESRCGAKRFNPFRDLWLIFNGCWLIVNAVHLFGLTYRTSWPLLIVGAGVLLVMRELFTRPQIDRGQEKN